MSIEDLAQVGIRAVADAAHENLCGCLEWPDNCQYLKPGQWEHGDETRFLTAVLPAIADLVCARIEADRDEIADKEPANGQALIAQTRAIRAHDIASVTARRTIDALVSGSSVVGAVSSETTETTR